METIYKIAVALPPGVSWCDEFTQPWSRYSAITQKKIKNIRNSHRSQRLGTDIHLIWKTLSNGCQLDSSSNPSLTWPISK